MEIYINGAPRTLLPDSTIASLLAELELDIRQVAVECNLELVPRAQHAGHVLRAGDRLEVVTFVGGG